MRAAFFLSVIAARLACAESLNKSTDASEQISGVSFGSPPQPVVAYFGFDGPDLLIPPFMNATNGANVSRNFPKNDSEYMYTSFTDDPVLGEQKVVVNGFELQNFSFEEYNPKYAYADHIEVGLCLVDHEYSSAYGISTIDSLKSSGYIKSRSFALFHNTSAPEFEANQVLFSAIDHGKYDGPLVKHKHYSYYSSDAYWKHPTLVMDGIAGYNFSLSGQVYAQITENTWWLPQEYNDQLNAYFEDRYGFNLTNVSCSIMDSTEYISFYFSGVEYRVLDSAFFYTSHENGTTTCVFSGVLKYYNTDTYQVSRKLFDHHYLVVDYDNEEIAIAQAATKSKPQTIEEMSTGIPSATPAKYYSYSSLERKTVILSDSQFYYTTTAHPTYSMYTGQRLGWSATESFYSSQTSSSTPSDSVTSAKPTASSTASNSTKASSSSKGAGTSKTAGALTFVGLLSAMIMF
ncbi:putative aspartic proteinase [Clavispora lusitaniae]|uniref:Aspartic proteinase n=1 Tax=Clavispora lusitaniae TaxID=36911 RepID=A0AA91T397_CLALS|nr:putative aspartic proteinase [Clavispora lusitaniae]